MNKVILMGRLVRDPEVRYSQGAEPLAVARYTLAVNRRFKRQGEQDADFIGCVAFGKAGEFAENTSKKVRWSALSVGCRYAAGMITRAKNAGVRMLWLRNSTLRKAKLPLKATKMQHRLQPHPRPSRLPLPMASIPLMKASKMMISPSKNLKKEDLES